ncbi:MAG: hypothetical protein JWM80_4788 [Cyanobacteria bacterium RYN_339]|nr:hypothetical protein [Cyanobacteria bacterium RYN_339]
MKHLLTAALLTSAVALAGCGATHTATMAPIQAAAATIAAKSATPEVATADLLAHLFAGHRAYQGRTVVGPGNKDAGLLTSYDGKQLVLDGTLAASKSSMLGIFKYVNVSATMEDGTRVNFLGQEFIGNTKADAALALIPVGKKVRVTFTVHRFSYRSDASSPFVYTSAVAQ